MSTGAEAAYGHVPRPPSPPVAPPPAPKRRGLLIAAIIAATVVALAIAGVVGVTLVGAVEESRHEQAAAAAKAAKLRQITTCRAQIGPFVQAVRDISAQLDVGMSQTELSDAAGKASIKRSRVDTNALSPACQYAFGQADDALTTYAATVSDWNDCIWSDDDCDPDDTSDLDLQTPWAEATSSITEAYDAMTTGRSGPGTDSRQTLSDQEKP